MKKRIITILFIIMLMTVMVVNGDAASIITGKNINESSITIAGNFPEAVYNQSIIVEVLKPEQVPVRIFQSPVTTSQNGDFSFTFKFDENYSSGYYTLRIGAYDMASPYTETFFYSNPIEANSLVADISKLKDASKVKEMINANNNDKILGLDNVFFNTLPEEIYLKLASLDSYNNITTFQDIVFKEIAVQALKLAGNIEQVKKVFDTYQKNLCLQDTVTYSKYQQLLNDPVNGEAKVNNIFGGFIKSGSNSVEEIKKRFDERVVLELIANSKSYAEVTDIFQMYHVILGIDLTIADYQSLKEPDNVSAAFVGKRYYTSAALATDFTEEVRKQLNKEKPKEPGGSKTGGSGHGGSSVQVYVDVALIPVIPTPTPVSVIHFKDVEKVSWAAEAIGNLASKDVVRGYEDGSFRPDGDITREEFVKILVSTLGIKGDSSPVEFKDVPSEAWYYNYLAAAKKSGVISGNDDGNFGVGEMITRQDMAVMLYRAAKSTQKELKPVNQEVIFGDETAISFYALESVKTLQTAGVVKGTGNGNFAPKDYATRAQACVMINTLFLGGTVER